MSRAGVEAWAFGADEPLTIVSIPPTYGRKEGGFAVVGLSPAPRRGEGTGEVLMCRLRKGRANTARGAANFLRETVSRVRHAGATGSLTMRADSGFYTHDMVAACRDKKVRYSITGQHPQLRNLIDAIPEADWSPRPSPEGGADVAETIYTPFASEPDAVPVRLIVRRASPPPAPSWPSSPTTAITPSSPTVRATPWNLKYKYLRGPHHLP